MSCLCFIFYPECQPPLGDLHYLKFLIADFDLFTDGKLSGQSLADTSKHGRKSERNIVAIVIRFWRRIVLRGLFLWRGL